LFFEEKGVGESMKKLRIALLLSLGILPACLLLSEPRAVSPELDHATVHVRDLKKSTEFYEQVMELKQIPEPFKDGRHVWFRAGAHDQLHVVGGATEVTPHDIEVHLAFRVESLPEFLAHLDQMQVKYRSFGEDKKVATSRPDGVKQVYLQDPDGYWIEVNDDRF
jgi:lactoylglutathione lyase